jgi:hypothetical protein
MDANCSTPIGTPGLRFVDKLRNSLDSTQGAVPDIRPGLA